MNVSKAVLVLVACILGIAPAASGQLRELARVPVDAYRVIGPIYYVGSAAISAHIIDTSEGLILIDTGTKEMLPGIQNNIEKLGHSMEDIQIILSSHAHWDHVEGHAAMKALTGAQIMAVGEDARAIANGADYSALGGDGWPPVEVDRILSDGDTVTLGDITLTAHLTPGHTKGCTTWTTTLEEEGQSYDVVFIGGTSINPGVNLVGNARHPSIAEDYARTFDVLKNLDADVFLAQHPMIYGMAEKLQRLQSEKEANPFIDPEGYRRFVQDQETLYVKQLAAERDQ